MVNGQFLVDYFKCNVSFSEFVFGFGEVVGGHLADEEVRSALIQGPRNVLSGDLSSFVGEISQIGGDMRQVKGVAQIRSGFEHQRLHFIRIRIVFISHYVRKLARFLVYDSDVVHHVLGGVA